MIEVKVSLAIEGPEGSRREPVSGWVDTAGDMLAVTEDYFDPGKYRVTHRKSGCGVTYGRRWSMAKAERKRRDLEAMANWDVVIKTITS